MWESTPTSNRTTDGSQTELTDIFKRKGISATRLRLLVQTAQRNQHPSLRLTKKAVAVHPMKCRPLRACTAFPSWRVRCQRSLVGQDSEVALSTTPDSGYLPGPGVAGRRCAPSPLEDQPFRLRRLCATQIGGDGGERSRVQNDEYQSFSMLRPPKYNEVTDGRVYSRFPCR